jgi:hypothetical protein
MLTPPEYGIATTTFPIPSFMPSWDLDMESAIPKTRTIVHEMTRYGGGACQISRREVRR